MRDDGRAITLPRDVEVFCADEMHCQAEYLEERGGTAARQEAERFRDFAKMGGLPFAFLLGHAGAEGHFEITRRALAVIRAPSGARVSWVAVQIMTEASQDPDFYEWNTPAAHAQARMNEATGVLRDNAVSALDNTFTWMRQHIAEVERRCAVLDYRAALYLLGYVLHAVQDFVFHEGMSNAEHSYRDLVDMQVDSEHRYPDKMELATFATTEFLRRIAQRARVRGYSECLDRMYTWSGEGKLYRAEKEQLLRKNGMDLSIDAVLEFRELGKRVRGTHFCSTCGDKRDEIMLREKWLGWYGPPSESSLVVLRPRMTQYLNRLFASDK